MNNYIVLTRRILLKPVHSYTHQLKKKEDYILQHEKYLPKIGDYDIYRCVGKGSFAEVYLGATQMIAMIAS